MTFLFFDVSLVCMHISGDHQFYHVYVYYCILRGQVMIYLILITRSINESLINETRFLHEAETKANYKAT